MIIRTLLTNKVTSNLSLNINLDVKNSVINQLLLEPGSKSSHESMIDKETKTKKGRYLGGGCLHTNTLG